MNTPGSQTKDLNPDVMRSNGDQIDGQQPTQDDGSGATPTGNDKPGRSGSEQ